MQEYLLERKCCKCGKTYKHYGNNADALRPNGLSLGYNYVNSLQHESLKIYSLCPECLTKFNEWINEN